MKKLLATIAAVFVSLIALPEQAEAAPHRHHPVGHSYTYSIGHISCGCAIYQRRVIAGYDRHHRPVYRYYSVPVTHHCRSYVTPHRGSSHVHHARPHRGSSYHRGHSSFTIRGPHGLISIRR